MVRELGVGLTEEGVVLPVRCLGPSVQRSPRSCLLAGLSKHRRAFDLVTAR